MDEFEQWMGKRCVKNNPFIPESVVEWCRAAFEAGRQVRDFTDNEQTREAAYCAVAHALAGIDAADMTICQNVVDSVFDAIKSVSRKL